MAATKRKPKYRRPLAGWLVDLRDQLIAAVNKAYGNPYADEATAPRLLRVKTVIYREVKELLDAGKQKDIERLVTGSLNTLPKVRFSDNPFLWAFYTILSSDDTELSMTYNLANSYSWQLLHAYRHHIEPELLIGFLYQTASSSREKQRIINKPGTNFREPWLQAYEQRLGISPKKR